ncbi:MAG: hypothetical protein Q8K82_14315 [Gemmatimonadaceae bacterium]|nr:hypothetical protein [Gemmatimonadaceae bacterium]
MPTRHNPDSSSQNADEPPDLPRHSAPWQKMGYLDENARLLVDAMYRHRDALAADHASVPVQDYQVLPDDFGPTGAMTCGVLMALWEHSPLCSGACPVCNNTVLALAFMGAAEKWTVTGVCTTCGHLAQRVVAADGFLDLLDAALEGTPYTLPTRNQMLSSNGQAHSALLPVLERLGEVTLPPPHYGFACSTPEGMRLWPNPLRARAWLWANKTTVLHVPTGARVEHTDSVFWPMVDAAYLYLRRTGRLPELEHAADHQLRYCFPMISQEPVVVPPRASKEREER